MIYMIAMAFTDVICLKSPLLLLAAAKILTIASALPTKIITTTTTYVVERAVNPTAPGQIGVNPVAVSD